MSQAFSAVPLTDRVLWVGAIDWTVRDFHGYLTSRGTTYNAYLILADRIALIDTVKAPFKSEMLSRIASVVEPGSIDYLISGHAEMDHSGSMPDVIQAVQPEQVVCSSMGVDALNQHFRLDRDLVGVKDGETLSLGNMSLTFFETRMLHWPDSMFTYLADESLLFSQDAFGMHLACSERFADEIDDAVLEYEAAKYYANILLPYSPLVTKLLDKVGDLGLEPGIIAPAHGPIWRRDTGRPMAWYGKWAAQERTEKVVIVYDTMWQSTGMMARAIGEGVRAAGAVAKLMPLAACHRSDAATELLDAGALVVGSPTLNSNMFPTVADLLTYLKGLKPQRLVGAAFGSYGWAGQAVDQVEEMLRAMKVDLVDEGVKVKYVPDADALAKCHALGRQIAERLRPADG